MKWLGYEINSMSCLSMNCLSMINLDTAVAMDLNTTTSTDIKPKKYFHQSKPKYGHLEAGRLRMRGIFLDLPPCL